jgi:carbonic anhydrase
MKNRINTIDKNLQQSLSPEDVLQDLKEGNKRYMNVDLLPSELSSLRKDSVFGQYPKAMILSCIDSRVVVERVFDQVIGDLFVARVAGNFSNNDIVASMEYACYVAGSKLIVVMGHEECGAVKAACDKVELGNITAMLENIIPSCEKSKAQVKEPYTSENKNYVNTCIDQNVLDTVEKIRKSSELLSEMEKNGEIQIKGCVYKLKSGEVVWL